MKRSQLIQTDIGALLLVAIGLGLLVSCYGVVIDNYSRPTVTAFISCCVILAVLGLAIGVIGRRRERQRIEHEQEALRRGMPTRTLMPMGDQVATVIARCWVTATIVGVVTGVGVCLAALRGVLLGQEVFVAVVGAVILTLGSTVAVGVVMWRRLRERNRKLAEPLCPLCGYVLFGAENQRCPECGMPFDLEEINTNLAYLDEQGRLQPKREE